MLYAVEDLYYTSIGHLVIACSVLDGHALRVWYERVKMLENLLLGLQNSYPPHSTTTQEHPHLAVVP